MALGDRRLWINRLAGRGVGALLLAASLFGCDSLSIPECAPGELRYKGRPPRELFAYDCGCRADCFSQPLRGAACLSDADYASCLDRERCGPVRVHAPEGEVRGRLDLDEIGAQTIHDRALVLVDPSSLGMGRALVLEFAFVDAASGDAPANWGFVSGGRRSYFTDQIDGSARFVMRTGVAVDSDADGVFDLRPDSPEVAAALSTTAPAVPGRLDILSSDEGRLVGRFYMGFKSSTEQPQGLMVGCFNVGIGPRQSPDVARAPLVF